MTFKGPFQHNAFYDSMILYVRKIEAIALGVSDTDKRSATLCIDQYTVKSDQFPNLKSKCS